MTNLVAQWQAVADRIDEAIRGLSDADLDRRGGDGAWSIRENVHHLVEANLVASNMILAALAVDRYEFDWTWVNPDLQWMARTGYDRAPTAPALAMLRALTAHIGNLLELQPAALTRSISVNDAPGSPRYTLTIEAILRQEIEHAPQHIANIHAARGR